MKNILKCLLLFIFFSNQLIAQTPEHLYKIYHSASGLTLDWNSFVNHFKNTDIIIWGEEHNDSIGHLLERDLLESLNKLSTKPLALSMEMFETDVQGIMDEYLNNWISEKNFKKEARAWGNYKDYEPLVNFAKNNRLNVICANAPARYVNMVTRNNYKILNELPKKTAKGYLPPLPLDTLNGKYYKNFLKIMGGHIMPNMNIYQAQNLWDASMANNILKASKKSRVFHINGRFHSDEYLGTAERVIRKTNKSIQTISCFPAKDYNETKYKTLADFVILTDK
ncbi:MAG TPA: ChaN family lipoprotein [Edaphocola sp.]|nr:ChaN family lipoprotein [Edaphocola sp.]